MLSRGRACWSSVRAGWRRWLRSAGPLLTSGCPSSPCKTGLLCPPTWPPPAPALSVPAPEQSSPLRSARGSPSRRPSECACRRPERGGNSEPGPPAKKWRGTEVTSQSWGRNRLAAYQTWSPKRGISISVTAGQISSFFRATDLHKVRDAVLLQQLILCVMSDSTCLEHWRSLMAFRLPFQCSSWNTVISS